MKAKYIAALFALLAAIASAEPSCQAPQHDSPLLERAERLVQQLPELQAWSKSHSFPVAYIGSFKPLVRSGKCFVAVSVYANRPERYESWNHFYVNVESEEVLVQQPSGEVVTLGEWRSNAKQ